MEAVLPIHSPDAKRRKTMVDPLFQWYRTAPRRVWDQVLGSGHHLQRTSKHVIARIHEAFKHGYITINTALVKDGFDRLASRTAWLAGVSRDTVEQVVREGNLGLGWADPKPRGVPGLGGPRGWGGSAPPDVLHSGGLYAEGF
jgi:hypothetical protein